MRSRLVASASGILIGLALGVAGTVVFVGLEPDPYQEPEAVSQPVTGLLPVTPPELVFDAPVQMPKLAIEQSRTMKYDRVLFPPDRGEHWWRIDDPRHGYSGEGTAYVIAHACVNNKCAGDQIKQAGLAPEDLLEFNGELYRISRVFELMRTDIGEADIWYNDPEALFLITCELTGNVYGKNFIVEARKIETY